MKKLLKNLTYSVLSRFSFPDAVILMYHSIDNNNEFFTVSPDEFERQLEHLRKNNFNVIKLGELANSVKNNSIKPNTVVLTFDDGFKDNYTNAFPILKRLSFPATIFITTSLINSSISGRNGTHFNLLDRDEIKEMSDSGLVEIGAHCHNHVKLAKLSAAEITNELSVSKKILEEITGSTVNSLAYPYGSFNEEVKAISLKYFNIACSVEKGRINMGSDPMEFKRNSIDSQVGFTQFKGIVKFGRV